MSAHPHLTAPTGKVAAGPARRLREALARAGLHTAEVMATGADDDSGRRRVRATASLPASDPATVVVRLDPDDARTLASIIEAVA